MSGAANSTGTGLQNGKGKRIRRHAHCLLDQFESSLENYDLSFTPCILRFKALDRDQLLLFCRNTWRILKHYGTLVSISKFSLKHSNKSWNLDGLEKVILSMRAKSMAA